MRVAHCTRPRWALPSRTAQYLSPANGVGKRIQLVHCVSAFTEDRATPLQSYFAWYCRAPPSTSCPYTQRRSHPNSTWPITRSRKNFRSWRCLLSVPLVLQSTQGWSEQIPADDLKPFRRKKEARFFVVHLSGSVAAFASPHANTFTKKPESAMVPYTTDQTIHVLPTRMTARETVYTRCNTCR